MAEQSGSLNPCWTSGSTRSAAPLAQRLAGQWPRLPYGHPFGGSGGDPLVGLSDLTLLAHRLGQAVSRSQVMVAVLFVDVDGHRTVDGPDGRRVDNELLKAVAGRLNGLIRPHDTLAYLGYFRFVVLCEELPNLVAAEAITARIGAALKGEYALEGGNLSVTPAVGISFAGRGVDISQRMLLHTATTSREEADRQKLLSGSWASEP